jgi:hypothetical protein
MRVRQTPKRVTPKSQHPAVNKVGGFKNYYANLLKLHLNNKGINIAKILHYDL